jgi:hypothetical protein
LRGAGDVALEDIADRRFGASVLNFVVTIACGAGVIVTA